ncbi:MAG TPA: hypothetical protein VGP93_18285 [Polyangiaceae bacterium]|nr:hypothetical protein [Polyangiaceae bacterium]
MSEAARLADYILRHVRERAPYHWQQGARKPAIACGDEPSVRLFGEQRLHKVPDLAVRGLLLVARGFPVLVSTGVFEAHEVLGLQARGWRCVSMLGAGSVVPAPHQGGLEFVLHDLCHLAKFADRAFYEEQVGFFACLQHAFDAPEWREVERELDAQWHLDRAQVSADMNGSSIYLLAVLKMKLKMAARRRLALAEGLAPKTGGKLSPAEETAYGELLAALLGAMDLSAEGRTAALLTSARRDSPALATILADDFRALGRSKLATSENMNDVAAAN